VNQVARVPVYSYSGRMAKGLDGLSTIARRASLDGALERLAQCQIAVCEWYAVLPDGRQTRSLPLVLLCGSESHVLEQLARALGDSGMCAVKVVPPIDEGAEFAIPVKVPEMIGINDGSSRPAQAASGNGLGGELSFALGLLREVTAIARELGAGAKGPSLADSLKEYKEVSNALEDASGSRALEDSIIREAPAMLRARAPERVEAGNGRPRVAIDDVRGG